MSLLALRPIQYTNGPLGELVHAFTVRGLPQLRVYHLSFNVCTIVLAIYSRGFVDWLGVRL